MTGIVVVAKAPVPGQAKTRLAAHIGDEAAADLAAAALLDTLATAELVFPKGGRVVALTGDLVHAQRRTDLERRLARWQVVPQRGDTFAQRLVHAHHDAAALTGPGVVQIGMDTPQLSRSHLTRCLNQLSRSQTVIGMASDGGWWVLAARRPEYVNSIAQVQMSTGSTGADTVVALQAAGLTVGFAPALTDVDTIGDATSVAGNAPNTLFARALGALPAASVGRVS